MMKNSAATRASALAANLARFGSALRATDAAHASRWKTRDAPGVTKIPQAGNRASPDACVDDGELSRDRRARRS